MYRSGTASPRDVVTACLARIERIDDQVGAVQTLLVERALAQADESARRWRTGTARALEGVPFGLKDIIATAGIRTTGGSQLYRDQVPDESAALAARLEEAGGVLLAKLQTFELACGANTTTRNPWDLARSPGGSSSGSAAAVAARELPLSIGTDTGGSIAIPAALTGIAGLKATYGRVPRHGVMPLAWTLDHAGPMTRSAEDAALALQAIAGYDPRDPRCSTAPVDDYLARIGDGVERVRIGVPTEWFFDVCTPDVKDAVHAGIATLVEAGARAVDVPFPSTRSANLHAIELTIIYAEMASLHRGTFDRLDEYGPEFQKLLTRAQFVQAADYLQALRARHVVQRDFENAFEQADVLIVPGCVAAAPLQDEMRLLIDGEDVPWIDVISRTTAVCNITGVPSLTLPAGFDEDGLPLSLAVLGRPFDEATCLRVGHAFQQLTSHHQGLPPLVAEDSTAGPRPPWDPASLPPLVERPVLTPAEGSIW